MRSIFSIEDQRLAYGGSSPDRLRQRMIERGEPESEMSDTEILTALEAMDEHTRWRALQILPDADIARLYGGIDGDDD
jgi:hypothetical protein